MKRADNINEVHDFSLYSCLTSDNIYLTSRHKNHILLKIITSISQ